MKYLLIPLTFFISLLYFQLQAQEKSFYLKLPFSLPIQYLSAMNSQVTSQNAIAQNYLSERNLNENTTGNFNITISLEKEMTPIFSWQTGIGFSAFALRSKIELPTTSFQRASNEARLNYSLVQSHQFLIVPVLLKTHFLKSESINLYNIIGWENAIFLETKTKRIYELSSGDTESTTNEFYDLEKRDFNMFLRFAIGIDWKGPKKLREEKFLGKISFFLQPTIGYTLFPIWNNESEIKEKLFFFNTDFGLRYRF